MLTHDRSQPENPARVVVLGGGGFIGSRLRAALERAGIEVLAPTSIELDLAAAGANRQLATLLRPTDALVVLAAVTPDKGRGAGPFLRNVSIGAAVSGALEKTQPAHVVYFSSDVVYPLSVGRITEGACVQSADLYGAMHLTREIMLRMSARSPVAILRPALVYGVADTHNSYGPNRFRRMAHKEGRITLFGAGEEMRDHVFVDDVVALTLLVLRHRCKGTLNIASGRSISFADLARKVAALFDRPIELVGTPRQGPITHRHFDIIALHKVFPTFSFTSLESGLAKAHREMLKQT